MNHASDTTVADLVARLDENLREAFEDRAAMREYAGGFVREYAECLALLDVAKQYPLALSGGTLLHAQEGRTARFVLTTNPDFAEIVLTRMGFTVHRRADLGKVLERFDGAALLSRMG